MVRENEESSKVKSGAAGHDLYSRWWVLGITFWLLGVVLPYAGAWYRVAVLPSIWGRVFPAT